jgi:hypothetical protein
VTLVINPAAWASVVVLAAGLAALAVVASARRYGGRLAAALAVAGAAIVAYTQLAHYDVWIELAGFGLLAAGVVFDLRRGTHARGPASLPVPE